jgi:endonuclease/exonuclease/phosphatase family metal-dependent hydrolase
MSEKSIGKRDIADRLMLFLNTLVLGSLLLAYLAGSISPAKFWPLAFVAMSYPIILASLALFMVYWLIRRRWFLFLNLAFLVAKWDYVSATVKPFSSHSEDAIGLKVMSYNVRLFDRYNWTENENTGSKIEDLILKEQPDILCVQEFYHRKKDASKAPNKLLSTSNLKQVHLKNYFAQRQNDNNFGVATLTCYPILHKGTIVLENSRSALTIFTDIIIQNDTVRVYNVHLQSIHLGMEGYQALDELLQTQELENVKEGKLVLNRMKSAFIKRAEQADDIANHIQNSPYPTIVCGDFNDVPYSYTYQTIASTLCDGFSEAGSGLGATYVRVPFFRIDNILYSEEFEAESHTVHAGEFSDHLAVTSTLSRKD